MCIGSSPEGHHQFVTVVPSLADPTYCSFIVNLTRSTLLVLNLFALTAKVVACATLLNYVCSHMLARIGKFPAIAPTHQYGFAASAGPF
eukprot:3026975-Pyramimonas_sp.AAC.1